MKPLLFNARKHRTLNIVIIALIFISVFIGTAKAGDIAERNILGFSPDGAYFAFEEYGVQDGSGYPFANFYIIETKKNSWVKGSPVRILLKDENKTVAMARKEAMIIGNLFVDKFKIQPVGKLLAHNPVTEIGRDPLTLTVAPGPVPFLKNYAVTFRVEALPIKTKRCEAYGDESQIGFLLKAKRKGGEETEIHKDSRIPTSRGCPKAYAISDIIRYSPPETPNKSIYIILLQVFSYGFEGDDGRFLAISTELPSFNAIRK